MQIDIHDVDHGACVTVTGPRGHRLMLDCGQSLSRPWFPSIVFGGQLINTLLLTNLDEDHVEDLEDLWGQCGKHQVIARRLRRSRLFGQLPGRNKLKAGSRLLVSPFPEIKFILSCCGVL